MAEANQQRKVPGAPPPQQIKQVHGKKIKKPQQAVTPQTTSNGKRSDSQEALTRAVHDATLSEKAPKHGKVDESVKVQVQDLAEEAERNSAIAAVAIIEEKDGNGRATEKDNKSPLQTILAKRVKVLSKKLQRAIAYEALEEDKLNADMKRIIASKPGLEGAVAELTEVIKAIEINEAEATREVKKQSKLAMEATQRDMKNAQEKKNSVLFQFLYLRSLFQPPSIPTFAPPPMPEVISMAAAQDVAAVEKLFVDLSSSTEIVPQGDKEIMIEKLATQSNDEVVQGVGYSRIAELIEGLSSPIVEQKQEVHEDEAAPSSGQILFMQDSEIGAADGIDSTEQPEPEGGPVEGLPESKEPLFTNGAIMGDSLPAEGAKEDGTAQAQVEEPIQTTEVGQRLEDVPKEHMTINEPSQATTAPVSKKIDWAADDDDWSDMMMQPSGNASSTAQSTVLTPAAAVEEPTPPKANGKVESEMTPTKTDLPASKPKEESRPNAAVAEKAHIATKSSGPEVDEDGFIIASSKRSKHLQQQQQQQYQNQQNSFRNGGRGGREGGRGQNPRGGFKGYVGRSNEPNVGSGRRGNMGADNRGRGRGRGMPRPEASGN